MLPHGHSGDQRATLGAVSHLPPCLRQGLLLIPLGAQAVWPKSIWGFDCLSLSLCKSIGIIEGTLVHGFSHAFWGSKGRISHKTGKSFTKWAFSLLINVFVPSTNIQSCQTSSSVNQEREETYCERKTQKVTRPSGNLQEGQHPQGLAHSRWDTHASHTELDPKEGL